MASLITPHDLPTWVPGRLTSASDGLGWKDVAHRAYLYSGLDVPIPAMDHFMIVRYRHGQTPMDRCIDGRWSRTRCAPGDFSLLSRAEASHWHWTECINVSHIYLSETLMSRVASDILERNIAEVRLHDVLQAQDEVVTRISDAITQEAQRPAIGGALYVEALAIQLVVHLIRRYASLSSERPSANAALSKGQLRRIGEFIDAHLHEAISIEQMAASLELGVHTFCRHFRAATGQSAYDYVCTQRVARAQRLLLGTRLAIKEIAAMCGFADQAHLSRAMKTRLGQSPGQLRRTAAPASAR